MPHYRVHQNFKISNIYFALAMQSSRRQVLWPVLSHPHSDWETPSLCDRGVGVLDKPGWLRLRWRDALHHVAWGCRVAVYRRCERGSEQNDEQHEFSVPQPARCVRCVHLHDCARCIQKQCRAVGAWPARSSHVVTLSWPAPSVHVSPRKHIDAGTASLHCAI
jgi:hypothetical protein